MTYAQIELVVILLGMFQALILLLALARPAARRLKANRVFIAFLVLVLLTLLGNSFFVRGLISKYPHTGLLMDDMFFLYGPLLYLYVGAVLQRPILFESKKWLHFVLPVLHIISMTEYMLMSPGEFYTAMVAGIWQYPYDQGLAIISIATYVGLSWKLFLSGENDARHAFLKVIFWVLLAGVLLWVNQFAVNVFRFGAGKYISQYTNPWTLFPLITIVLGYFAVSRSAFFESAVKKESYSGSTLSARAIADIQLKLETLMKEQKPYLDPRLSVDEVAKKIEVSKKDLSRVINQQFELNFFDFVNTYRLEEFKRIATPEAIRKHKILGLAFDAGFNSKSAFNKVFKRLENQTPSEYLKQREV